MDRVKVAEVFVAIVERGSLAGAAQFLGISRPMVTRYLNEMESWAGARLLNRSTRRMSLTPAGERILEHCQRLQLVSENIAQTADAKSSGPRGLVRMTCVQSLAEKMVVPALAQYLALHSQVSIDLMVDSRVLNMVEERIDLAIRVTNNLEPSMIARRLGDCNSVVCASPDYLAQRGTPASVQDLSNHNCISYGFNAKQSWNFTHGSEAVSVTVQGSLHVNDTASLTAAVVGGLGVAMLPEMMVKQLLDEGKLVRVLPEYKPEVLGIHAVYISRNHMSVTLRTLLDFLVDWFKTYPLASVANEAVANEHYTLG
ncbi:LysR family transcriptional regulator [Carnimonas bestiolae]|uniref:LysR family transcriptional regulator n=1 Tax=Carnimonas bestiolae TaxID=3402172 RepID=UPI003EDC5276